MTNYFKKKRSSYFSFCGNISYTLHRGLIFKVNVPESRTGPCTRSQGTKLRRPLPFYKFTANLIIKYLHCFVKINYTFVYRYITNNLNHCKFYNRNGYHCGTIDISFRIANHMSLFRYKTISFIYETILLNRRSHFCDWEKRILKVNILISRWSRSVVSNLTLGFLKYSLVIIPNWQISRYFL